MKKINLKMNTRTSGTSVASHNLRRQILHAMLWTLGAFALSYVLLIGSMVFNITERKVLEADASALSNKVGELELAYLSMSNQVDLALGYSMGFKEIKAKFATRKSLGSLKIAKNEL